MRTLPVRRRLVLFLAIALALAVLPVRADDLEDFLTAKMQEQKLPGVAYAVLKDGEVIRSGALGYASVELKVPVTRETLFQIGSVTKQFTARAILMLADEGKLHLDDPIGRFVPGAPAAWNRITLYHLLTHTSGIPNWVGMDDFSFYNDYTEREFLAIFGAKPLDFAPGERFKYSSAGYSLLTFVIEKTSGMRFGDFLTKRIFEPAGMTSTTINDGETIVPGRAEGYIVRNGTLYNGVNVRPRVTAPSGAVLSTVEDLARYEHVLRDGLDLKPASRALVTQAVRLNNGQPYQYAMGWYLRDAGKADVVYHSGTTSAGFRAAYLRDIQSGVTVIFLCNAAGDGVQPVPIAETVARMFIDEFQMISQ